jgi:catechol-2,3-dioxygenase
MLGAHPVDVMLLATDLGVARRFYGDTLGLEVLLEDEQLLTFRCGGDSRLVVTKSTTGTREETTKASWRVDDLAGEVAELRARGVQIQDLPELGTVDGIADIGFALAAWFIDPHHNWIGLLQLKDPGPGPRGAATGAGQAEASHVPGSEPSAN